MSGFQVDWHGFRFDLQWGQVASETDDELRIHQPDGGAWIIRDVPGEGLSAVFHAPPPDPLLDEPEPEPWVPARRPLGGEDPKAPGA